MMVAQTGSRGRYEAGTPSVLQSPTTRSWVGEEGTTSDEAGSKSEWRRRLREQPEDLGRWLCWKSRQAGCMTVGCLFVVALLLGGLSFALVKVFTAPRAATAPELSKVRAILHQEAAGRRDDYSLSAASFTPQDRRDLTERTVCDSVHFIIEHTTHNSQATQQYITELLHVHSHWAEAFARHCFLSLHVEEVGETNFAPFRAAGYLNALALEGSLITEDDDFPWTLYTPVTTVPANLFYGIHDLVSLLSIGLNKRVSLLDRVCFHDSGDAGCVGSSRRGVLEHVHRPDGVNKIALVLPLAPQMDGPPVVQHSSFLFQPSRLAGWFLDVAFRAAEVGTATADPLSWAAEHLLGVSEDVLQKLSLNPANEHIWQSACHGGDIVIARTPQLEAVRKWSWAQNLTDAWFPEGTMEKSEPTHIVFVCSRILESQACQKDVPDPMLKFTCGDFGANLVGCEESVSTLSHEFGECRTLIPELMEKEKERFRKHQKEHKRRHPAHGPRAHSPHESHIMHHPHGHLDPHAEGGPHDFMAPHDDLMAPHGDFMAAHGDHLAHAHMAHPDMGHHGDELQLPPDYAAMGQSHAGMHHHEPFGHHAHPHPHHYGGQHHGNHMAAFGGEQPHMYGAQAHNGPPHPHHMGHYPLVHAGAHPEGYGPESVYHAHDPANFANPMAEHHGFLHQ
eukprot:Gregarina_sp_Pseudo_9__4057@NODE_419_length_2873_cov_10_014114_g396_i0_p1_GENE_NODE_419_length_2873_cov_10_014114_g396_i0NODE_419_length_2873_cov_10_014114_g396_i0_p1_ORF_typecomplete_len676_score204_21_NODE_419_length_2873_cov_10_014114_g396_i08132840